MLVFENISKNYGKSKVLDNVDLKIDEGEFVFLTGPSGAGKTTLMRLILRDEVPDEGKIYIDTVDLSKLKSSEMPKIRRKVGFVFQDFKLLPTKSSFENVSIALEIVGKTAKQIKELVPQILDSVGIKDKLSNYPWQLSGGEKQRLAIARALALEPKIIVADEPTGNLDSSTSWEIINLLSKINEENGTTIMVATHDVDVVNTLKKRTIILNKGRISDHA